MSGIDGAGMMKERNNFCRFFTSRMREDFFLPRDHGRRLSLPEVRRIVRDFVATRDLLPRTSLYFNFPLCAARCRICNASAARSLQAIEQAACRAVTQIDAYARLFKDVEFQRVCLHNGRYLVLSEKLMEEILGGLVKKFRVVADAEYLCEAIPFLLTKGKLRLLRDLGWDSISLGIQSLDTVALENIARPQTAQLVFGAIESIRSSGFRHLNVDLIAGLPGEDALTFAGNIRRILAYAPDAVTIYPFVPESCFLEGKNETLLKDFLRHRQEALMSAGAALVSAGYEKKGLLHFVSKNCRRKKIETVECVDGFLSGETKIGIGGQTYLDGISMFEYARLKGTEHGFYGMDIGVEDGMYIYLKQYFLSGVMKKDFYIKFGCDVEKVFEAELLYLRGKGRVIDRGSYFVYKGIQDDEGWFEYFSDMKLFMAPARLSQFAEQWRAEFFKGIEYSYAENGGWKRFHDFQFATRMVSGLIGADEGEP